MRAAAAFRTTGAGSTTLPIASLYATAGCTPRIVEIGVWNTTATAVALSLKRLTTAGTQGSGITETNENDSAAVPVATVFDTHTVAPSLGGVLRNCILGAAVGSGMVWTFAETGVIIPSGTGNGIGIIPTTGTGQICDVYFSWIE